MGIVFAILAGILAAAKVLEDLADDGGVPDSDEEIRRARAEQR